jgi:hypothetical protein
MNNEKLEVVKVESSGELVRTFVTDYTKAQIARVSKLSEQIETLNDKLFDIASKSKDHYVILSISRNLQESLNIMMNCMKQLSVDDKFVNLIMNDNKTIIEKVDNRTQYMELNGDERKTIRLMAEQLVAHLAQNKKGDKEDANNS